MRVLVTGGTGFVGPHLIRALESHGHEVVATGVEDSPAEQHPQARSAEPSAGWLRLDLTDAASVADVVRDARPDALVHLAGLSSVSRSWDAPERTFDVNATGALRLLRELEAQGQGSGGVLLVGSGDSYGRNAETPAPEDTPLAPRSPYAASKAAQEMVGHAFSRTFRVVSTRSFMHIGPGQRPPFVIADWARQLLQIRRGERDPFVEVGDTTVRRDVSDVRDVVDAYVRLLESDHSGVFNVCTGRTLSLDDLLDRLQQLLGTAAEVRRDPARMRPADLPVSVGDPSRLRDAVGWAPRPIEETLRDLVDAL